MDAFNFVFTLFGLLLGLSLAEVLSGFAKSLQVRHRVKLGWLTPLLAIFVMLDITSFWSGAWELRDHIKPQYAYLVAGLAITGIYYLAASIVFPRSVNEAQDFDAHYFAHNRQILGAVLFCNATAFAVDFIFPWAWHPEHLWSLAIFYGLLLVGILSRSKAVNISLLTLLIFFYAVSSIWSVVAPRSS